MLRILNAPPGAKKRHTDHRHRPSRAVTRCFASWDQCRPGTVTGLAATGNTATRGALRNHVRMLIRFHCSRVQLIASYWSSAVRLPTTKSPIWCGCPVRGSRQSSSGHLRRGYTAR